MRERHLHHARIGRQRRVGRKDMAYASGSLRILGYHIKIASAARARQLIAQTQVIDKTGNGVDTRRIGAVVESHVLLPSVAHETSHTDEIVALYGVIHFHRMVFHLTEQTYLLTMIEKHSSHNLGQNILGRAGDAGVEQQVTRSILRVGKQVGWQTAYERLLSQLLGRLEQLHTTYHTAILVLPSAAGGQQLLKYESTLAYLGLVPSQSAEIAYGTEHRRGEYAAGAETATSRYGRKECNLQSASPYA